MPEAARLKLVGRKLSAEHKRKLSVAKKGRTLTAEHRKKIGAAQRGRKASPEKLRKMSLGLKGIVRTKEWREKQRLAHLGVKHSLERRRQKSESQKGERSHFWKGGVTAINQKIRTSLEYKLWRTAVFERDGYACVWGGKEHGKKIQADHIKPFAYFPELRFAIDNGRTLCLECHKTTDTYANKAKNYS